MHFALKILCLLLLATSALADSSVIPIGNFAESGLAGWSVKRFKGETEYRVVADEGRKVLQAISQHAASGLVFKTAYHPKEYPLLTWNWKVANIIAKGDSRSRETDDYAARIYVVFPHWFFPKTRTLNYIWANQLPQNSMQPSVYTDHAVMIAVESGPDKIGRWTTVRRNIVDDYRQAFGEDPPQVGAIAIMTDTDNTGETATAWYSEIAARRQ